MVVDADFSGKGYDLRTTEKNIQLYNQLSGRAGRFSKKSIIIYQTISPHDQTLKEVISKDPEKFLHNELDLRKKNEKTHLSLRKYLEQIQSWIGTLVLVQTLHQIQTRFVGFPVSCHFQAQICPQSWFHCSKDLGFNL